jgi:hypothetical protein
MLAEIFMVRLEMQLRIAAAATSTVTTSSDRRFVPVNLPRETPGKTN